ncbi:hypothetical protein K438DRAFT_1835584 [Mycena galopus ATCC 62051]|nr:hypothetical protein K438DRAFT_1835584 [Mycena galopus ATCC 62051]
MDDKYMFERPRTPPLINVPVSPISACSSGRQQHASFVITPSIVNLPPRRQPNTAARKPLTINTDCLNSDYYGKDNCLDSASTGSSAMQTAVDDDPYASSFFLTSSKASMIDFDSEDVGITSAEDKEMTSPLLWEFSESAEGMSRYCSTQSSFHVPPRPKIYDRSATPSPDTETTASPWHDSCWTSPNPKSRTPATPSRPLRVHPRAALFISFPDLRQPRRRTPHRHTKVEGGGALWSHFSRLYFIRRLLPHLSRLGLHFRRLRRRHRQRRHPLNGGQLARHFE